MQPNNPPTPASTGIPSALPPPTLGDMSPLGEHPSERIPIRNAIEAVDAILRQPRRVIFQLRQPDAGKLIGLMLFVSVICCLVYGVVVGTFSGGEQLWVAPVKVTAGLIISAIICLPSLYIFTCLSGSQAKFMEIFGLLAGLLMLMTILLVGFAPVAWIFSQSSESLAWMGTLHFAFWFVATIFGLRFLESVFSHSQARSRAGFATWVIIFLLVAIQMTTALRPILGKSDTFLPKEKQFFLGHWANCLKLTDTNSNPGNTSH